ncbi:BZ3500_MvSof-1268-A1-R1_Chr1-1g01139 [Microbotryum saponariae]|uniref:BZ3500_MvSof-1268-A1-R1_Chr1-1g01139 protein n=1 Tax=Microbotryum saponariae TaxID=289078 RepID=A0A2X0MC31_9BASI|nr:BZ3500_MvSof-1268-A1-R1_Chr1-1g01139 [Microbotryum saponariae]SCZ93485.1 BZ3501_MvSof-1269-A2-R1_Chr1-1g00736 [Microbotryum saponariae]
MLLQLFGNDQVHNLLIGHFSPTSKVLLLHIDEKVDTHLLVARNYALFDQLIVR